MEIRQLEISELENLLDLYLHMHVSDDPLPEQHIVDAVWNEINDNPCFQYFGVFVDRRLVSSCTLSIVPNLSRGCRPYGVIENVVTHTEYRRKGYGSAVLTYALKYAWSKNCYKAMLMTGRKNEATYEFYESVGFDRVTKQAFIIKPKDVEAISLNIQPAVS